MDPFHITAIPHEDILQGRLTMEVFAADLWEVYKRRGPEDYRNPDEFFRKTYQTQGLTSLLDIIEKRLGGRGGDPVIQIQTPFGGGKTHSLIAMYHKAGEWAAKRVVIVGTALDAEDTIWGELEQQLKGKITKFQKNISPGREALRALLEANQPLLILMDEILEYVTKAAGVKVEESTLAAQTTAFLNELTECVGTLDKVSLVISLPSSVVEHFDESAEELFNRLQKVSGRVEKIYTPVQEHEIAHIIRRRLFSAIDEEKAQQTVNGFMEYMRRENLLPPGIEPSEYRKRFLDSFPFLPEVTDVLYHRWGSFPSFQRTRGVLRLLSLVLYSLKESSTPYITLADFDLNNQEIRRELLKHIGPQFDSVIAADITGAEAGSRRMDSQLGEAYQGLRLGTRTATTIFMYSFSGGSERGATMNEVKRSSTTLLNPSSVITEALDQLAARLFYLYRNAEKSYFSNTPNLNQILLVKMDNIETPQLEELEEQLLKDNISGHKLRTVIWPSSSSAVPDSRDELKLVVLKEAGPLAHEIAEKKGTTPRVYRNTLFLLTPEEGEKPQFQHASKKYLAYKMILDDKTLNLTPEQRKEVTSRLKDAQRRLGESLRTYYRTLLIPSKEGLKSLDLGIPTFGEETKIDEQIYTALRSEGELLERIAPLVIKERYLRNREYVLTEQIYTASMTTPGETRVTNRQVWENGINEGVQQGLFGLGEFEDGRCVCHYYKEPATVSLTGSEAIIQDQICKQQMLPTTTQQPPLETPLQPASHPSPELPTQPPAHPPTWPTPPFAQEALNRLVLEFDVPKGSVSSLMGVLNLLQSKFSKLRLQLSAEDGQISKQDYEDKVMEAFRQMGIEIDQ